VCDVHVAVARPAWQAAHCVTPVAYHFDVKPVRTGDDTEVQPAGWPQEVLSAFEQDPQLMLLLLKDAADPGFPSFPVLRVNTHLKLFGELLPDFFANQGEGWWQILADSM